MLSSGALGVTSTATTRAFKTRTPRGAGGSVVPTRIFVMNHSAPRSISNAIMVVVVNILEGIADDNPRDTFGARWPRRV